MESIEDAHELRAQLIQSGLVAFIANGSILPRKTGESDEPMEYSDVIPFRSPPMLEVVLKAPHKGKVRGMGIKKGVTLIVGGGFHGKSTLLKAIETGVYNKVSWLFGDSCDVVC